MRKTNAIILSFFFLLSIMSLSSFAIENLYTQQTGTHLAGRPDYGLPFGDMAYYYTGYMTFNITRPLQISKIEVQLYKEGTPISSVFMAIFNTNGTVPTTLLYNSTISYNANNFSTSCPDYATCPFFNFTFTNQTLNPGFYAIVLNTSSLDSDPNRFRFNYDVFGTTSHNYSGYFTPSYGWVYDYIDDISDPNYKIWEGINTGTTVYNVSVLARGTNPNISISNYTFIHPARTINTATGNITLENRQDWGYYGKTVNSSWLNVGLFDNTTNSIVANFTGFNTKLNISDEYTNDFMFGKGVPFSTCTDVKFIGSTRKNIIYHRDATNAGWLVQVLGNGTADFITSHPSSRSCYSTTNITDKYVQLCTTYDGYYKRVYVDSNLENECDISSNSNFSSLPTNLYIGAEKSSQYFNGTMDDVAIWSRVITTAEMLNHSQNIVIQDPTLKLYIPFGIPDYLQYSLFSEGYYKTALTQIGTLSNFTGYLTELYNTVVSFGNYTGYEGSNFTRRLLYNVSYICPDYTRSNISLIINTTNNKTFDATCDNTTHLTERIYPPNFEGFFNINISVNNNLTGINVFGNKSFYADITPPTTTQTLNILGGGFSILNLNSTVRCYDTVLNKTFINATLNGAQLYYDNRTNNLTITNTSTGLNGQNVLYSICSDLFSSTTSTLNDSWVNVNLSLIDERNNTLFDVNNITAVIIYSDDNSTSYNFKTGGVSSVLFNSKNSTKLRLELTYPSGDIVTRWLDPSIGSNNLRICANRDGVKHYEQIVYSANNKPIQILSLYANCTVAQDYTRFAYQESKSLKFYTTTLQYSLYKYVGLGKTLVAGLEGTIQTAYNLDALEYSNREFNIGAKGTALNFNRVNNTLYVTFTDALKETTSAHVTITNTNTSEVIYDGSTFTDYNNINIPLDITTLTYVDTDIFKISLIRGTSTGTETLKRYFNINGNSGTISNGMALIFSAIILLFGLTFTSFNWTFGWFGAIITLISIFVLSLGVGGWYVTFMMAIEFVILLFILIFSFVKKGFGGLI